MGDTTEGSSSAAQSAQETEKTGQRGFWGRLADVLTTHAPVSNASEDKSNGNAAGTEPWLPGIVNLRQLRVEDVAVPKADIISVPTNVKKDDLVDVFRKSGLSRLPVFKGTMDSPVGLVHLKDFSLRHGFNGNGRAVFAACLDPAFAFRATVNAHRGAAAENAV